MQKESYPTLYVTRSVTFRYTVERDEMRCTVSPLIKIALITDTYVEKCNYKYISVIFCHNLFIQMGEK